MVAHLCQKTVALFIIWPKSHHNLRQNTWTFYGVPALLEADCLPTKMESKRTTASHFKLSFPKGFTLLEVLIAMTIMATSALLLSTAWRGNHVRLQKIQINKKAAFLLEETLTELTFKYQNRLSQLPEQENGQFASNPLFTWSMKSQKFTMPDLNSLLVAQDQGDGALLMMMDQFKKYLNQSVKEVQVTVTYTKGKRKIDYSATTLLVDYDQPLPFGL